MEETEQARPERGIPDRVPVSADFPGNQVQPRRDVIGHSPCTLKNSSTNEVNNKILKKYEKKIRDKKQLNS